MLTAVSPSSTDGLVYAAYLFIVAVGLTLIFGVMKMLNVAHGSFYAFGAYGAATAVGIYFDRGLPAAGSFLLMVLVAMAIGLVLGVVLERGLLRFVYGRDEIVVVLVTYAAFLILEDVILLVWGPTPIRPISRWRRPATSTIGDLVLQLRPRPGAVAGAGRGSGYLGARPHPVRAAARAVIYDREMAVSFGIDVGAVYTVTFVIGAMLGALGGAVTAPTISVAPGIGVEVIVLAFAVVVIGGLGSVTGTIIGALMVGLCRAAAVHLLPQVELFVIYAVMSLVLILRPQGLFAQAQRRI